MTDHKTLSGLAPSIMAASSSSRGRVMKYWRKQENIVSIGKEGRNDQRKPCTQPANLLEECVGWDNSHRNRQEYSRNQHDEQKIASGETESSKTKCHERAGDQHADLSHDGVKSSIPHQARVVYRIPDFSVVFPRWETISTAAQGHATTPYTQIHLLPDWPGQRRCSPGVLF